MNLKKINDVLEKCGSLADTLEIAHDEAIELQKALAGEHLDVLHIANAQEVVAMRIGYYRNLLDAAEEKAAAEKAKAEAPKEEPPKTPAT